MKKFGSLLLATVILLLQVGCTVAPPSNTQNICSIFNEYPSWKRAAKRAEKNWQIPTHVQMAIVHQESHFVADAKPERGYLFGVVPWKRPSTAYGYAQAKTETWDNYRKNTGKGGSPDNFADAIDFVGWYNHQSYKKLGIARNNTYELYLAYHEGWGGYQQKTYRKKPWLMKVAEKVDRQAKSYQLQLKKC